MFRDFVLILLCRKLSRGQFCIFWSLVPTSRETMSALERPVDYCAIRKQSLLGENLAKLEVFLEASLVRCLYCYASVSSPNTSKSIGHVPVRGVQFQLTFLYCIFTVVKGCTI